MLRTEGFETINNGNSPKIKYVHHLFGLSVFTVLITLLFLSGCAITQEKSNDTSMEKSSTQPKNRNHKVIEQDGPSIAIAQDDVKVQLIVADRYYKNNEFVRAEKAYLNAIRLDNDQPVAHYRLGNIAFRKGEFQQASVFFETALALAPRNPKIHYNLAASYLSLADKNFTQFMSLSSPNTQQAQRIKQLLSAIQSYASPNKKGQSSAASSQSRSSSFRHPIKATENPKDPLDELADILE